MSPLAQSLLHDWSPPILVNISLVIAAFFYLRGWIFLRRSSHDLISPARLAAFFAGISFLWIAIGSHLSAFDESSLTVHMIQHILLMLRVEQGMSAAREAYSTKGWYPHRDNDE